MDMNKLVLNNYKTHLMVLTSTKKHANHLFLHTGGRKVTWCKGAFKYYISRVSQILDPHVSARLSQVLTPKKIADVFLNRR